jgi:hypothetical protein
MGAHVLLPLVVNSYSKSEQKVDSLPRLGFEPVTFGTQAHLSDRRAKSHPLLGLSGLEQSVGMLKVAGLSPSSGNESNLILACF